MSQPFNWTPDCQSSFNMLCSKLANSPIVQLPDPNKPYLLLTDTSKFCYSGMPTQASTDASNKTLRDALTSVQSQTQDLHTKSNEVHPVAYISDSFTDSQCHWPARTKECFGIFMSIKKCSFYLQNSDLLVCSDHKPLLKILQVILIMKKYNTWGLKAATFPRCVKVQHFRGMANILPDSVSRLRAVSLYHDLKFKEDLQDLRTPFEPLPPIEQSTHIPVEFDEIFIKPNIENHMQNHDEQNTLPITKPQESKLSIDNISPKDIPELEQEFMSLPELTQINNQTTKEVQFLY